MMTQKVQAGDPTTINDLLVHNCDHAYTVASILELLSDADLLLIDFADPDKYSLPDGVDKSLAKIVADMPNRFQRYHFAELLRGDIFIHSFWVSYRAPQDDPTRLSAKSVLCPYWRFVGYRKCVYVVTLAASVNIRGSLQEKSKSEESETLRVPYYTVDGIIKVPQGPYGPMWAHMYFNYSIHGMIVLSLIFVVELASTILALTHKRVGCKSFGVA